MQQSERTPPEKLIQYASTVKNCWIYEIDGDYGPGQDVPPEKIIGAWKVNEMGQIEGPFIPNPSFISSRNSMLWPARNFVRFARENRCANSPPRDRTTAFATHARHATPPPLRPDSLSRRRGRPKHANRRSACLWPVALPLHLPPGLL